MLARGRESLRAVRRTGSATRPGGAERTGFTRAAPTPVDETCLSRQRKDAAAIPVNVWLAVMDQGLVGNDLQATLPMLVAPTLLVWGDKDELVSHERKETLRAALPKAKVKVYPDFGHNPMWEDPADLAREMKAFLKD